MVSDNMGLASKGFGNGTAAYGFPSSNSFPHYKKPMPSDQKAKLLAMHKAGRANAGIYVAVVLAVYVILLTILLCRYAKRQRPSEGSTSGNQPQPGCLSLTVAKLGCGCGRGGLRSLLTRLCCPSTSPRNEPIQEITDYPLSTLQTKLDPCRDKPTSV